MPLHPQGRALAVLLACAVLAGCASAPAVPKRGAAKAPPPKAVKVNESVADRAATNAAKMIGRPYKFGGATPGAGFDFDGKVAQRVYQQYVSGETADPTEEYADIQEVFMPQ